MAHASPFSTLYLGPYKVVNRDTNYFCIQIGNRQELINVSRLKPFYSECVQPAVPPRRGRPPAARPGADLQQQGAPARQPGRRRGRPPNAGRPPMPAARPPKPPTRRSRRLEGG